MRKKIYFVLIIVLMSLVHPVFPNSNQPVSRDIPFWQDYSERFPLKDNLREIELKQVRGDRNGVIQVVSASGLLRPYNNNLVLDKMHRPLLDMQIVGMNSYQSQFIYLTPKAVFSNAWAGKFYVKHDMPKVRLFTVGSRFDFLIADEKRLAYFSEGKKVWSGQLPDYAPLQILFDASRNRFLILAEKCLYTFETSEAEFSLKYKGTNFTCIELIKESSKLLIGAKDGYFTLDAETFRPIRNLQKKLPWTDITCIKEIGGKIWFGTSRGAFALSKDESIDYYASRRWLVDDEVVDIAEGPDNSVLVLSRSGLSQVHFKKMTLEQKAEHFDNLTRQRHVRYGLNSAFAMSKPGDFSTGVLVDQDNDGLWTAMYLAGELFRYAVTQSEDARQNCYEAFEAMERLDFINPLKGFPARAFERHGYKMADVKRWRPTEDSNWDWKATTSSDEIVGHFFVYSIFAETIKDAGWRNRAVNLMDRIMEHIVRNNWYLIDYDGKPTLWGKWHPDYVNQFPKRVGDRRLNSVEIISFLQTAYHFTQKEIYKTKAFELMEKYGYLDNIMIPITRISRVPGNDLAADLSSTWNHSDDELAFLSYWILYKYAFNDELREKYRRAIKEHWDIERPEKNRLWIFIYAMTGAKEFDLEEAMWSLRELPLDMVGWTVRNSHRKDLEFLAPNFRNQTIRTVLPPDERPMSKYNGNAFQLDGGERGLREYSGDIFLLPYWMGRYLRVIDAPL